MSQFGFDCGCNLSQCCHWSLDSSGSGRTDCSLSLTFFIQHWSFSSTVLPTWWKTFQLIHLMLPDYVFPLQILQLYYSSPLSIPAINGLTSGILVNLQMSKAQLWSLSTPADQPDPLLFPSSPAFTCNSILLVTPQQWSFCNLLSRALSKTCHLQYFVSNYSWLLQHIPCARRSRKHWLSLQRKKKCWWTTSCHNLSGTLLLFLNEDFKLVATSRCKVLLQYITELTNYACNWFIPEALFSAEFIEETQASDHC